MPVPAKGRSPITGRSGTQRLSRQVNHSARLVEDGEVAVEELGELDAPAGAALDRVVGLDPADGEHLVRLVDHVEVDWITRRTLSASW